MVLAFTCMLCCRVLWKQCCILTSAQHGVEKAIWDLHIGQHSGVQLARLKLSFFLLNDTLPWCRLGNKAFSYSLPIQPQSSLVQPLTFSTPGIHSGVYAVELSRTQCRLCQKALAELVPQSIRLQREALAHERYLEPVTANQLATYMLPDDVLLAATDQVSLTLLCGTRLPSSASCCEHELLIHHGCAV